jgi:hypothetical protein
MLNKPDQRVLSALAALEDDHNFSVVLEWMESSLGELDAANRTTKDEILSRWGQGAAQTLADIVGTARSARVAVSRMK